jgi:MFS family permease
VSAQDQVVSRPTTAHLVSWKSSAVIGAALVAFAAGFGQFGAVAALGDVARTFGHVTGGVGIVAQAGLSGSVIGAGLAILRLASLASLWLTGLADRVGRRRTMLAACAGGLALTAVAAASPSYWWFVALFALGRPLLSAASAVAQVAAAELTRTTERAKAISLIAAGYGVGAGLLAVIHGAAEGALGFRGLFSLSLVPLALLPLVARWVVEPSRFTEVRPADHRPPVLGPVGPDCRGRLIVVAVLAFAVSVITGPAYSLAFLYAQNVRHMAGLVVSAMVVASGVGGLLGLLAGRWLADHWGRRPTVAVSMAAIAGAGVVLYSGSRLAVVVGYVLGITAGSLFAPAGGALANELFPTAVRASAAGWSVTAGVLGAVTGLLIFGVAADAWGNFGFAALVTFVPAVPLAALLWLVPETKGAEPEELWPSLPT